MKDRDSVAWMLHARLSRWEAHTSELRQVDEQIMWHRLAPSDMQGGWIFSETFN